MSRRNLAPIFFFLPLVRAMSKMFVVTLAGSIGQQKIKKSHQSTGMEELRTWPLLIEWNVAGATSGIGKEAARVLAKRGAHVILAVRNVKLGETVSAGILLESPTARVDVMHLNLNSLTSVREFVENFKARKLPLNILL